MYRTSNLLFLFIFLFLLFGCSKAGETPIEPIKPQESAWTPDRSQSMAGMEPEFTENYWNTNISFNGETWIAHLNDRGTLEYATGKGVEASSNPFEVIDNHPEIFHLGSDNFKIDYDDTHAGIRYVIMRQLYDGLWVWPSKIDFRYGRDGSLVMVSADMFPDVNVNTTPSYPLDSARQLVEAKVAEDEHFKKDQLVVFVSDDLTYHLAWMIEHINWIYWIDAHNGSIIHKRHHHWDSNEFSGHIHTIASQADPLGSEVPYTINALELRMSWNPNDSYPYYAMPITDYSGDYQYFDSTYSELHSEVRFYSHYVNPNNVIDFPNNEARINKITYAGEHEDWYFDNSNSLRSERSGYVWVMATVEFLLSIEPTYDLLHRDKVGFAMQCNVNRDPWCNAWANENGINFHRPASGCLDTGHVPDIIVHEYGHFNTFQQFGYDQPSSMMHEGMSDTIANLMTENHYIGWNVAGQGSYFRNSKNDYKWPAEWCGGSGHCLGQLLAGAFWDMYEYLGKDYVGYLYHFSRYGRPQTFTQMALEVLIVDDDDGDWTNGTPNYDIIYECFKTNHNIDVPDVTLPTGMTVNAVPESTNIHIPQTGGNFNYDLTIKNWDDSLNSFHVWAEVRFPGGGFYGPIIPPGYLHHAPYWLTFNPNQTFNINLTQMVPAYLPPGNFLYFVRVGEYGVEVYDETYFRITIDD